MSSSGFITAEHLSKNLSESPSKNFIIDWDNERKHKTRECKYVDIYSYDNTGNKTKLVIGWKKEQLRGRVKGPEERKFAPVMQFRKSSGSLGTAICLVYDEFKKQIEQKLADKSLKIKESKRSIKSIVQTDLEDGTLLEDPIIRFKLPFRNGKPVFGLFKVKNKKLVKVSCNEDNIHEILKSGTLTSGSVSVESIVFSSFGISIPATVKELVIKPKKNNSDGIFAMLTEDDIDEMNDSGSDDESEDESDINSDEEEKSEREQELEETPPQTLEDQLKNLTDSVDCGEGTPEAKPEKKTRGRKKK